jgi:NAD(P)-dependent dehydrogenase (short-subunit alcohol dehydrogenase family)
LLLLTAAFACLFLRCFFSYQNTVNNVGVSHEIPADFVDTSPEELATIINVNVTATLRITSLIAPAMASRYVTSRHPPLSPMAGQMSRRSLDARTLTHTLRQSLVRKV